MFKKGRLLDPRKFRLSILKKAFDMVIRFLTATYVLYCIVYSAGAQVTDNSYGANPSSNPNLQRRQLLQQRQQPAVTAINLSGTIEAVATGRIQFRTDSNEKWMAVLNPQTKIQVTGEAGADFLRPGMYVRFTADVDKRGAAAERVEELTVFTPEQKNAGGNFSRPAREGAKPEGLDAGRPSAIGPNTVQGKITSFKKNKLQIKLDKGTALYELSDNPKIRLDLADYSWARRGDKIQVQGMKTTGVNGLVQAAQVNIQLAEQLGEKKKK
jgi:hypothetical protein